MALSDIIVLAISATTVTPTQAGFGTPLLLAYHTHYSDRVRIYNLPSDLVADGFSVTEPAYLMATALKAQNPSITQFMVGRRALPVTQIYTLTINDATVGDAVAVTLQGHAPFSHTNVVPTLTATGGRTLTFASSGHKITASSGSFIQDGWAIGDVVTGSGTSSNNGSLGAITALTDTEMDFASGITNEGPLSSLATLTAGAQSTSGVANALKYAINAAALSGVASVAVATNVITVTGTAGTVLHWQAWNINQVDLEQTTTDPGVATDLTAIATANNDWYGLAIESQSKAEILAAATYCNTNKKLLSVDSSDTACTGSGSSDVMSVLKADLYEHTTSLYNGQDTLQYSGAAMMGNRFPFAPGSDTWAFKGLKGVLPDTLSATQYSNVKGKNGNVYTTVGGIPVTQFGRSADGEFIDTIRGIDWLQSIIQTRLFAALAANPKIPFTDSGIGVIIGIILGCLNDGVRVGLLVAGTQICTAPKAASVDTTDKSNRNLPNVQFSAELAGAIHTMSISGNVVL